MDATTATTHIVDLDAGDLDDALADLTGARSLFWKDPWSALTHFAGLLLALWGAAFLLVEAPDGSAKSTSLIVYSVGLVAVFLTSSSYHFFDFGIRWNARLRRLDHAAIFLLIAGTATPMLTHLLDGAWRTTSLAVIGTLAVLGVIFKLVWFDCPTWLSTATYVGMGWLVVIPGPVMFPLMTDGQITWLIIGGAAYSVGALVYAFERPNPWPDRFGHHEVWHLFVLVGAGAHYAMTLGLLNTQVPAF